MGSACYVYAIVGRDTPLPRQDRGDPVAGLVRVPWNELAAIVAPTTDDRPRLTTEAALHHEAVVEAVRQHGPALPVRFGTVFRDAAAIARALAERYDVLRADLERVGDKVEMSLTVLWPPLSDVAAPVEASAESAAAPRSGAAYLRARAAELERGEARTEKARALSRELDKTLGGFALERRVALAPKPIVAVRMTYLLDPAAVAAFRAAFDVARPAWAEWRMLLTGPWPPYGFVRQRDSDDATTPGGGLGEIAQRVTERLWGRAG